MSAVQTRMRSSSSLRGSQAQIQCLARPSVPVLPARRISALQSFHGPSSSYNLETLAMHAPARRQLRRSVVAASGSEDVKSTEKQQDDNNLAYTLGMAALWIGISVYAFKFSPNQTPYRDQIFLRLLVGLREPDENFVVNQVFTALFNVMGVWPAIYASLLIPGARSANKLPAWPFVSASFAFGVFALLPYFVFWRPLKDQQLPPPKEELEGWNKLFMKGAETPVLPAILLAAGLFQIYMAATASPAAWNDYFKLIDESRLVHVTTLDFLCLTALAPFWMSNDADGRKWEQRDTLIPILSVLPVVGPAIYLLLRPKTDTSSSA